MKIEAFVIHLERAAERRGQVEKIRAVLPVASHMLPAIDWKELSESEFSRHAGKRLAKPHFPFRLQKSEIACFLSHRKAWAEIEARGLDAALILEDDIEIDPYVFSGAFELAKRHFDIGDFVRFPERLREAMDTQIAVNGSQVLFRSVQTGLGMLAQLVSVKCARQLLRHSATFDRPVDGFLQLRWLHGIDPMTVFPAGVREVSHALGGSTIAAPKSARDRLHAEIARPVYRFRLARLARKTHGNLD